MAFSRDRKPQVPEGWVARWDDESSQWYYGKLAPTTQWEAPAGTVFPRQNDLPPYEETVHCDADETLDPALELQSLEGQYEHADVQKQRLLSSQSETQTTSYLKMPESKRVGLGIMFVRSILIICCAFLAGMGMGGLIRLL